MSFSIAVNAVLQFVPLPFLLKWFGHLDIKNALLYLQILSQDTGGFYEEPDFDYIHFLDFIFVITFSLYLIMNKVINTTPRR